MHFLSGDWRCCELYMYEINLASSSVLPCNSYLPYAMCATQGKQLHVATRIEHEPEAPARSYKN
jgi:hypothetical protein